MLGDSAYDTLDWHDHLLAAGSCQSLRTTHETPTIRKTSSTGSKPASTNTVWTCGRSIDGIDENVQSPEWSRTNQRRRRDCGLRHVVRARGRVHARAQVFLALPFRLVVAITNDERGDNPGSTVITL